MKKAYPNVSDYMPSGPAYDLGKWMSAMRDIYVKLHLGASKNESVVQTTEGWNPVEKREFLEWLKYYESGDHTKYKRAQHSYYVNDDINYFLPNPQKPPAPSPIRSLNDQISQAPDEAVLIAKKQQEAQSKEEQRKLVEDQRKKILGRLNSAERLLSSHQGQMFAGPDFEKLLSAIYELKKQIQTVNKISLSAQTIVDLIVRQANILRRQGHDSASDFMVKFAQNTPGDFSLNLGEVPAGGSQPQGEGSLGNNPPNLTGKDEITENSAVGKFIDNLESGGITDDTLESDDSDKDNEIIIDDDVMLDQEILPEDENDLVVHAQAAPPEQVPVSEQADAAPIAPEAPPTPEAAPENLEVESPGDPAATGISPEEVKQVPNVSVKNDFDALIESVFSNLTISDVVSKLEDINKIFRNREIGRQLAIVDVMLDHLGLAPYFPSLAEATNKQLEANQYCLTRIEDILSKLRGTMQTTKIDLTNENPKTLSPEAEAAKQGLEQEENKEKQRKEVKKQIADQSVLEKAKPEAQVEGVPQELAAEPTQIEAPPQPPTAPAAR